MRYGDQTLLSLLEGLLMAVEWAAHVQDAQLARSLSYDWKGAK